jgi:tRNA(fMet)-specific endonuclease VapC
MARYLIDASVAFAAVNSEMATLARLARLDTGDVALSAIVHGELLAAAAAAPSDPRLAENIALLAGNLDVLPFDRAAAEAYGALLRGLEPKRRRALDRMTAAQAIAAGLTLVTRSPEDFSDIAGLRLESWA